VDPSSRQSGGSLLGDRARIEFDPTDREVFIRSTAAGERLGGLAWPTRAAAHALAAAFDVVVIETVGVGQAETEIVDVADTVAVVVQPGSGDALQFLKSGIMEIPDVLVVTKADLGQLAVRTRRDLSAALRSLGSRSTPVLAVSSLPPVQGIDELVGNAVEYEAGQLADERAVEFVAQREFDLAGGRGELEYLPLALETSKRSALEVNRHPVRTPLLVARGEIEVQAAVIEPERGHRHALVTLENDHMRAPGKKFRIMLGPLDQIEGACRRAADERRSAYFHVGISSRRAGTQACPASAHDSIIRDGARPQDPRPGRSRRPFFSPKRDVGQEIDRARTGLGAGPVVA